MTLNHLTTPVTLVTKKVQVDSGQSVSQPFEPHRSFILNNTQLTQNLLLHNRLGNGVGLLSLLVKHFLLLVRHVVLVLLLGCLKEVLSVSACCNLACRAYSIFYKPQATENGVENTRPLTFVFRCSPEISTFKLSKLWVNNQNLIKSSEQRTSIPVGLVLNR